MHEVVNLLLVIALGLTAPPAVPTGRLSGRVTAEGNNAPIAGVRITAFPATRPSGPMGPPPQVLTDRDGRFAFEGLAPGEYHLDVQKSGFASIQDQVERRRTFTVVAGQSSNVSLQLQKGAVISGRVLDERGDPVTDAHMMVMRRIDAPGPAGTIARYVPARVQAPQQTNDLGEYRIAGLAAGEYYVAVVPRWMSPYGGPSTSPSDTGDARATMATTFYPGTTEQAAAQAITVAAGAEVPNIVFTAQTVPAFRVSGLVVDENGNPQPRAMVMLLADPRGGGLLIGPSGGTQSGEDGRFVIGEVPAGTYRVTASVPMRFSSGGGAWIGSGGTGGIIGGSVVGGSVVGGSAIDRPAQIVVSGDTADVRVVVRRRPERQ